MKNRIAEIIVDSTARTVDRLFHYEIPEHMGDRLKIGMRVEVPFGFGNRRRNGFVIGLTDETSVTNLKAITEILDPEPVFDESTAHLAKQIRDCYLCSYAEALKLFVPPGTMVHYLEIYSLTEMDEEEREKLLMRSPKQKELVEVLKEAGGFMDYASLREMMEQDILPLLSALLNKKIIEKTDESKKGVQSKTVTVYFYCGEDDARAEAALIEKRFPGQARVLELLGQCECLSAVDIVAFAGVTRSVIHTLEKKGLIDKREQEVFRNPVNVSRIESDCAKIPTEEQKNALEELKKGMDGKRSQTYLMRGVTGSGKTEVYLQAIEHALQKGKTAMVLVPEISLTPQITKRFIARFGKRIAILHSALSLGERLDEWKRIRSCEASVVIGARSAVFAPLQNIGIIIIDEEHEHSYKSEMAPRYHAREVAEMRARAEGATLLLASATPSIESMYRAQKGEYRLLTLEKRYNEGKLPTVEIIDMGEELRQGNRTVISNRLREEIEENLRRKEQIILFINRRGFSTFVSCRNCGHVMTCENCNVSLTYHRYSDTMNCHYCGEKHENPTVCPACGSKHIRYFGAGTQKIQEDLKELFPTASIVRMDMDTTSGKGGHEKVLNRFSEEKADILLGTQMVAKGLDYPDVTLVGVLAADTMLNIDDYRAGERTFDLITQVCGRAGRGEKKGRAILQTYTPDNPILRLAAKQDYPTFYEEEINYRKLFCYPPFCDIINIVISGEKEEETIADIRWIGAKIKECFLFTNEEETVVFGPSDAPISKIKNRYRKRIWLKTKLNDNWYQLLGKITDEFYGKGRDSSFVIDINPNNMF